MDAMVKPVRILKTLTWVKILISDNQKNIQCKIFISLNIKKSNYIFHGVSLKNDVIFTS